MKKTVLSLVAALMLASAAGYAQTAAKTTVDGKKPCYVDANNNKVCDKYENHTCKSGNGTGAPDCRTKGKEQQAQQSQQTKQQQAKPQPAAKDNKKTATGK
jgi:hypothetical protein